MYSVKFCSLTRVGWNGAGRGRERPGRGGNMCLKQGASCGHGEGRVRAQIVHVAKMLLAPGPRATFQPYYPAVPPTNPGCLSCCPPPRSMENFLLWWALPLAFKNPCNVTHLLCDSCLVSAFWFLYRTGWLKPYKGSS